MSTSPPDFDEEQFPPTAADVGLVVAAANGELAKVEYLVENEDADICYQDTNTGMSVLMAAAGAGQLNVVKYLLEEGAPWNAVDRAYLCAGDYAARKGHQDCVDALLDHAVMSELILSMAAENEPVETPTSSVLYEHPQPPCHNGTQPNPPTVLNAFYLGSKLEYSVDGHRLTDTSTKLAVMMDWEKPLMTQHAAWVCHATCESENEIPRRALRVLNVGFGMGIVDKAIQKHEPGAHTIIEAHPEVLKRMTDEGWMSKPGVRVLPSRWQDAVVLLANEIETDPNAAFDGIFFDTYAEDDRDLRHFHSWLPKLLCMSQDRPAARYSYYNGLCPDNVFFHGVACETMRLHLNSLGINCAFKPISVDASDSKLWQDISKRYWYFDTYYLPQCVVRRKGDVKKPS